MHIADDNGVPAVVDVRLGTRLGTSQYFLGLLDSALKYVG